MTLIEAIESLTGALAAAADEARKNMSPEEIAIREASNRHDELVRMIRKGLPLPRQRSGSED